MENRRDADSIDNARSGNNWNCVRRKGVQPRYEQADVHHPAAIVHAMVDRMNDLPVAIHSDDHHACGSAVQAYQHQCCAVEEDAERHCIRVCEVVVSKNSRQI